MVVLLHFLPKFTIIHNIFYKNKHKYASSNGTYCQINDIYEESRILIITIPSGKQKVISSHRFATTGRCYNYNHNLVVWGKASSLRIKGIKSKVRGVAKNPVDHPHGGRTKTNKPEVSPWGWVAKKNK